MLEILCRFQYVSHLSWNIAEEEKMKPGVVPFRNTKTEWSNAHTQF